MIFKNTKCHSSSTPCF